MRGLLVSHPHAAAFATWTAQSFARHQLLACYATGAVAVQSTVAGMLIAALGDTYPQALNRALDGLSPDQLSTHPITEGAARSLARLAKTIGGRVSSTYDAMFLAHDARIAASRWPATIDAVYAYEDGAAWTMARAHRRGLRCIWDLPLPHFKTIQSLLEQQALLWPGAAERPTVEPAWKQARKERERALADVICVASPFTRESLERVGTKQPVVVTPYPFPVVSFPVRTQRPTGPTTFLAVGSHDLRKGTPYLLEAWRKAALPDAVLRLIGPLRLSDPFLAPYRGSFEHVPHLPRALLGEEYRRADALVFPTLGDGFGIVMQEAMCSGTPVITTRCGGGPVCITSGEDGWIVRERDIDALVDAFRFVAADRERAYQIGQRARARAERWTSEIAGDALVAALSKF